MPVELKVIQDFYDLMLYLVQRMEKFPRHHRYSLGTAREGGGQTIPVSNPVTRLLVGISPWRRIRFHSRFGTFQAAESASRN